MPSPWVIRALRSQLPVKEFTAGTVDAPDRIVITSDERTALALRDVTEPYQGVGRRDVDTADTFGTVRALRAFGIAR